MECSEMDKGPRVGYSTVLVALLISSRFVIACDVMEFEFITECDNIVV